MALFLSALCVSAEEDSVPSELSLILYVGGVVDIDYELDVDPLLARVNITLFGRTYENLIVKDQEGILLGYDIFDGYLTVDVLGSPSVRIRYSTSGLTNKLGSLWSLNIVAPINLNIQVPKEATIISLDPAPLNIRFLEDGASITMPAGEVEISYVIGVVGTRDHALALRKEAEAAIEEFRAEGYNVEGALPLLQLAQEAYDEGHYIQAEEYARQVKAWIDQARNTAQEASVAMGAALIDIESAEDDRRKSLLDQARTGLDEAQQAYASGSYEVAKRLAEQASITAQLSESVSWFQAIPILPLIGTVATAPLILVYFFRKRVKPVEIGRELADERAGIDLDLLFEQHSFLRLDDKEVIRFICESGGGVFASELRDHFDLPKSSAWRMIRRLEKEEIIETRMVGRETYIEISPRYIMRASEGVEPSFQTVPAGSYYQS